ncbi:MULTISPECIES: carbohydrate kinase family protein [Croceitalea]|uniref:Carbohydrate kinase n=1 Tax=Croceitalea vernalis TaxID=3075599 RepID=A0ABU3BCV1_9FLAO|nr:MULTISPECIES: carbohydrate kinase [unclassified Croceitalea]MDT0538526.1 carbohydrate kinase [Croceitalea sp. P059]MDT0620306.1 carbohydrate kinase [Croceitalea sp. P007]
MTRVFCIGELLIDFVAENQGNDLSKAINFTKKAGGAPANVACAISKLGGKSSFIGCVGKDPFGSFLLDVLKNENVDISKSQRANTFTTLAFVSLAEDGERDFVFSRGADRELKYDSSIKKDFDRNMIHLGAATAMLGGGLEEAYGHYFFDALTKDAFISFDPNFRTDLWKDNEAVFIKKCMPYVEKSHLCKFSLEEAFLLSGKDTVKEACEVLHKAGAKIITITLGKEGTFVSTDNMQHTVPSIKVSPVDTTGAGDAFIGCLLYQISQLSNFNMVFNDDELLMKMVEKANKAGAITTTNYGAIIALPTLAQLED